MQKIRTASKSPIAKIAIGLLALSFISWGATGGMVSMTQNEVIDVAGSPIYYSEVQQAYAKEKRRVQNLLGTAELTPEIEHAIQLPQQTVSRLITRKVLEKEADQLDLRAHRWRLNSSSLKIQVFTERTTHLTLNAIKLFYAAWGSTSHYTKTCFVAICSLRPWQTYLKHTEIKPHVVPTPHL